eukprot:m.40915 g.40915  ORF g.40915 m.40915 type:complete len:154 (-) comp5641_c0_seq2:85-546(-)
MLALLIVCAVLHHTAVLGSDVHLEALRKHLDHPTAGEGLDSHDIAEIMHGLGKANEAKPPLTGPFRMNAFNRLWEQAQKADFTQEDLIEIVKELSSISHTFERHKRRERHPETHPFYERMTSEYRAELREAMEAFQAVRAKIRGRSQRARDSL